MDPFVSAVVLGTVVWFLLGLVKEVRAGNWNAAVTRVASVGISVGALFLLAETQWASQQIVLDTPLSNLGFWDTVVAGVAVSSTIGVGYDVTKAFDSTQSAEQPPLTTLSRGE